MKRRVDVIEEVPDVTDDNAADFVLGHDAVDDQAECHQDPGEVWGGEDQHSQEAEASFRVATTPDVDQTGRKGRAQEGKREKWRENEERGHGVEQKPREVGRRSPRRFLQEARVSLQEEHME